MQWVHTYEFNDRLLGSIFGALGENFSDYEVYEANPGDLLVIAVAEGRVPRPAALPEKEDAFMEELRRIGTARLEAILARSLGTRKQIEPLFIALAPPVNSDFRPFVQLEAPKARFQGSSAYALLDLASAPLPILEMAASARVTHLPEPLPAHVSSLRLRTESAALEIARGLTDRGADPLQSGEAAAIPILLALKRPGALCGSQPSKTALDQLHRAADITLANLGPQQRRAVWIERNWLGCTPRSAHVRERLDVYAAIAARDPRAMLERARSLLDGPAKGGDAWGRYLLTTAMLGAHAAGDSEEGRRLWEKYGKTLYRGEIPPYLVYLASLR